MNVDELMQDTNELEDETTNTGDDDWADDALSDIILEAADRLVGRLIQCLPFHHARRAAMDHSGACGLFLASVFYFPFIAGTGWALGLIGGLFAVGVEPENYGDIATAVLTVTCHCTFMQFSKRVITKRMRQQYGSYR